MRVMARLNLTLDESTTAMLSRYARVDGRRRATLARELLHDALSRRQAAERGRRLAADYAHGRKDDRRVLADLEGGQLDLLVDDDEP